MYIHSISNLEGAPRQKYLYSDGGWKHNTEEQPDVGHVPWNVALIDILVREFARDLGCVCV